MSAAPERPSTATLGPVAELFLCGAAALFWELVLIRYLGSTVRVVAYYSNFVLTAAFLGLGAGALLTRRTRHDLRQWLVPALAVSLSIGALLVHRPQLNPTSESEFIWGTVTKGLPFGLALGLVYASVACVFSIFGQWIGRLFEELPALKAYSVEVAGSLLGIAAFGLLALLRTPPWVWLALGFLLLLPTLQPLLGSRRWTAGMAALVTALVYVVGAPFVWSPYYRIHLEALERPGQATEAYVLHVNHDYHQMLVDLTPRGSDSPFAAAWRRVYDAPYDGAAGLPPGPILVVGAGTGNDVAAALRRTDRRVDAVEIDPSIAEIGRQLHFEAPYANPRVRLVIDDARSFFEHTRERYAMVVFGFLDSHTLLSSFSSVRLDNFVYTRDSFEKVRDLLVPGGRVAVTFAVPRPWVQERLTGLLRNVLGVEPTVRESLDPRAYGTVFLAQTSRAGSLQNPARAQPTVARIPTDDWPFLYLARPVIPGHYLAFMVVTVGLGIACLGLLPRGERRLRLPYFFLGAGFFLIETSNLISLSLLFGSTWTVNLLVFSGILALILVGNLVAAKLPGLRVAHVVPLLLLGVLLAYAVRPTALLRIETSAIRSLAAVLVFLGPVFFAAVVFARLIRSEAHLSQAYGSNLLGAMVGGASEYVSLVVGFRPLLLLTLVFYVGAFLTLRDRRP